MAEEKPIDQEGVEPVEEGDEVQEAVEAEETAEVEKDAVEATEAEETAEAEKDAEPEPEPEPEPAPKPAAPADEKPAAAAAPAVPGAADAPEKPHGISGAVCAAIAAVALVVGVLAGHFLLGSAAGGSIALNGRTTLSSGELDSTIATYTSDGVTHNITAREVLTYGGAELAANEDGTYDIPAADSILNYAQTQLMLADAAERGVTATEDDINEFLSSSYGVDLATFASGMGMTEDAARDMLTSYVTISKLGEEVISGEMPEMPTEPTAPSEGEEDTPTAEYAEYVIALLGDEWDSDANDWATTDGEYYNTLSSYEISNDSATYAAASAAYSVAMTDYQKAYNTAMEEQDAYTNELFSNATIQIGTLA